MSFSVVVPAHNEARVIERILDALYPIRATATVIVVVNGSTDNTEIHSRSREWVQTIVLGRASKAGAINAGLDAAPDGPVIVVDADINVSASGLRKLADLLDEPRALVGSLRAKFNLEASSRIVKLFYQSFLNQPYVSDDLVGLGLWGLSSLGRERVGMLPTSVLADDLYIQRAFAKSEIVLIADEVFEITTPRNFSALLRVRRRIARGNKQLAEKAGPHQVSDQRKFARSTKSTILAILTTGVRTPTLLPAHIVYMVTTVLARASALNKGVDVEWERDDSSREI